MSRTPGRPPRNPGHNHHWGGHPHHPRNSQYDRYSGQTDVRTTKASTPRCHHRSIRLSISFWMAAVLIVGVLAMLLGGRSPAQASPAPILGTTNAPEVHVVLSLGDSSLHPRQLAYDRPRNGLWF